MRETAIVRPFVRALVLAVLALGPYGFATADLVREALVAEPDRNELSQLNLGTGSVRLVIPGLGFPPFVTGSIFGDITPSGVAIDAAGTAAFVTEGRELSKVDLATGAITLVASGFESALTGVALGPDETTAYVVGGSLYAVDLGTGSFATVASSLGSTRGIALNPAGTLAYISSAFPDESALYEIELATGRLRDIAAGVYDPFGLDLNSAGTTAYVLESRSLSAVDLATGLLTRMTSLLFPLGVALNGDDTTAFVTELDGRLLAVDLRTGGISTVASGLRGPSGVTFHAATGTVYVTLSETGELGAVDPATGRITPVNPALSAPGGVAIHPAGIFAYVAEVRSGEISVVDLFTGSFGTFASGLSEPFGVAVDPIDDIPFLGTVYVTETGSGELTSVDIASGEVTTVVSGLNRPQGLALDRRADVAYVLEPGFIAAVNLSTRSLTRLPVGPDVGQPFDSLRFGLALSRDGSTAYVIRWTDFFGVFLLAVDIATGRITSIADIDLGPVPTGVALDPDGTAAYIAGVIEGILQVDLSSGSVTRLLFPDLDDTSGIAVGSRPCVYQEDCGDRNPCTADFCDLSTQCMFVPVLEGASCSDDRFCGAPASCVAGACLPASPVCDDGNPCTDDTCDVESQSCLNFPRPEGTSCSDGLFCNGEETCRFDTTCQPGVPVFCDDQDPCTIDMCTEAARGCASSPLQTALLNTLSGLTEVDLSTGASTLLYPSLFLASDVALEASGTTAFVTSTRELSFQLGLFDGEVLAVDIPSGRVTRVATGFKRPRGIAVNASGTRAFVTDEWTGVLSAVDVATGVVTAVASGLSLPTDLVLSRTETIAYVLEYEGLTKVDLATGAITRVRPETLPLITGPGRPVGIALNSAETSAYLTFDRADDPYDPTDRLLRIDLETEVVALFAPISAGAWGLAVNADETVAYLAASPAEPDQPARIVAVSLTDFSLTDVARIGSESFFKRGLALSADGSTLFVSDVARLAAVALDTRNVRTVAPAFFSLLALSASGTTGYATSAEGFSRVDLETGRATLLVPGLFPSEAALTADEATAFLVHSGPSLGSSSLSAVDLATGRLTPLLNGLFDLIRDVAVDASASTVYLLGHSRDGDSRLRAVDLATGNVRVTPLVIFDPFPLPFPPILLRNASGLALSADGTTGFVTPGPVVVDLATGQVGFLPAPGGSGSLRQWDLALNAPETIAYVTTLFDGKSGQPGDLLAVDLLSGAATPVVSLPALEIFLRTLACPANRPPQASAGVDLLSECTSPAGATVTLDGTGSSDADSTPGTNDDIASYEWFREFGSPSQVPLGSGASLDATLPIGNHSITLLVTDRAGATSTDEVLIAVFDATPPEVSLSLDHTVLWPPNHRMVDIEALVTATDTCSTPAVILHLIESSEPDDAPGSGDGSTANDVQGAEAGTADFQFLLRAERSATGSGRTYTAAYTATDATGNASTATATVLVPHDRQGGAEPLRVRATENGAGTLLEWDEVPGALSYNVARGEVRNLGEVSGVFLLGPLTCIAPATRETTTLGSEDAELPPPGEAFFYVVEYSDGLPSSYGSHDAAKARVPSWGAGGCPTLETLRVWR